MSTPIVCRTVSFFPPPYFPSLASPFFTNLQLHSLSWAPPAKSCALFCCLFSFVRPAREEPSLHSLTSEQGSSFGSLPCTPRSAGRLRSVGCRFYTFRFPARRPVAFCLILVFFFFSVLQPAANQLVLRVAPKCSSGPGGPELGLSPHQFLFLLFEPAFPAFRALAASPLSWFLRSVPFPGG